MERLAHLIENEVRMGSWLPIRASRNGPCISNLALADDIILFCETYVDQAKVMKSCLDMFCAASGSTVSYDKSRVYFSPNTDMDIRGSVRGAVEMEVTEDFGKYLGVPTLMGGRLKLITSISLTK